MKAAIQAAEQKENDIIAERDRTIQGMGNIVHDSVPVSDNEVRKRLMPFILLTIRAGMLRLLRLAGQAEPCNEPGLWRCVSAPYDNEARQPCKAGKHVLHSCFPHALAVARCEQLIKAVLCNLPVPACCP